MNGSLPGLLDQAAATLVDVERTLHHAAADAAAPPGVAVPPGVARALHERWAAAVAARADEVATAADHVLDAAAAVRTAGRWSAETDELVAHRFRRSA